MGRTLWAALLSRLRGEPLSPLVEGFLAELREILGRSSAHVYERGRLLRHVVTRARARTLRDWTAAAIRAALGTFKPRSRTQAYAWDAAYAFSRWLMAGKLIAENPLTLIPRPKIRCELRRRPFSVDEFQALYAAARARRAGQRAGAGAERAACYLTALTTGLRKGEIAKLEVPDLALDQGVILLRPEGTKNGKREVQPLLPEVIGELRALVGARRAGRVFATVPAARTIEKDLRRAGIARETADGRVDFHALRHSFGTALGLSRTLPRLHQGLMRHSDPRLTSHYSHVDTDSKKGALEGADVLRAYLTALDFQRATSPVALAGGPGFEPGSRANLRDGKGA